MADSIASFADFALSQETLKILEAKGFTAPTPIQTLVIPPLLDNRCDLIAQAQTGTGKTAAYALPIIETLLGEPSEAAKPQPRALILAPTRELAMQISSEMSSFTGARPLKIVTVYGGQPVDIQLKFLRGGADIIVGTPGRVIDFMERGALKFDRLQFAVLDEADEMLDMGFVEDIERILDTTPEDKRMLMFSATVPDPIRKIAERFMHDAEYIAAPAAPASEAPLTEQWACEIRREDKFQALRRILAAEGKVYAMVFCRTRGDVDELTTQLQRHGFSAEALHGELTQNQRTRVIEQFKNHRFDMLVATDVAARGIDVNDLSHVINYALPQNNDLYTHRIGRTGRAGKHGVAITLFTPSEGGKFARLRRAVNNKLEQRPLPDAKAIIAAKKTRFAAELAQQAEQVNPVYRQLAAELSHSVDPESLLAALLELRFGNELLIENYPSLGRASSPRERHYGPSDGPRGPRRREFGKRPDRGAPRGGNRRGERSERDPRDDRGDRGAADYAEKAPRREKTNAPAAAAAPKPPRPKLRDWALNVGGEATATERKRARHKRD